MHSDYTCFDQYVCSLGVEPTTFCAANTMLYHWATGTLEYSNTLLCDALYPTLLLTPDRHVLLARVQYAASVFVNNDAICSPWGGVCVCVSEVTWERPSEESPTMQKESCVKTSTHSCYEELNPALTVLTWPVITVQREQRFMEHNADNIWKKLFV